MLFCLVSIVIIYQRKSPESLTLSTGFSFKRNYCVLLYFQFFFPYLVSFFSLGSLQSFLSFWTLIVKYIVEDIGKQASLHRSDTAGLFQS